MIIQDVVDQKRVRLERPPLSYQKKVDVEARATSMSYIELYDCRDQ